VKKSDRTASHWVEKAAHQGLAGAQYSLRNFYREGNGIKLSATDAFLWYEKVAHQGEGEANAQSDLGGMMFRESQGVKRSNRTAFHWFGGSTRTNWGLTFLGSTYYQGQGVQQSNTEEFCWYEKAAHQGLADDQFNSGVMYREVQGVKQSDTDAFRGFDGLKRLLIKVTPMLRA